MDSDAINAHLSRISNTLDGLSENFHSVQEQLKKLDADVRQTQQRVSTMLYAFIMEQMSPKLLKQLIPSIDETYISDPWSMCGAGLPPPAEWLRESVARAMMNTAFYIRSMPHEKSIELFRYAIDTTPLDNRGHIYKTFLYYLHGSCYIDWKGILEECMIFEERVTPGKPDEEYSWCLCIAAHGENNQLDKAMELIHMFCRHYNPEKLAIIPEAAYYAAQANVTNRPVDLTAWFMGEAKKNSLETTFRQLLGNKSIAIVGGGPQELGKGKGKEIDSHDIVIRINHASQAKLAGDYGSKTDIFVWPTVRYLKYAPIEMANTMMLVDLGFNNDISPDRLDIYEKMRENQTQVFRLTTDEWGKIVQPTQEHFCFSSGGAIVALVKALRPDLSPEDLYGFSHFSGFTPGDMQHAEGPEPAIRNPAYPALSRVNYPAEIALFQDIFGKRGFSNP